jgi:hypothetical protein
MCNCASVPVAIADPVCYQPGCPPQGLAEFAAYFQELDTDDMLPTLRYEVSNYRCGICSQRWYLECAPEESTFPLFALKDETGTLTERSAAVRSHKDFLEVLAHRGFGTERCIIDGCTGFALNGRALCNVHFPVGRGLAGSEP